MRLRLLAKVLGVALTAGLMTIVAPPAQAAAGEPGAPDPGFVQTTAGLTQNVQALAVQLDGKLLIGGSFQDYYGDPAPRLMRLNPDGTRDNTFQVGTGPNASVTDIAVQPNGQILVAGFFTTFDGAPAARLVRLNPDGSRDTGFVLAGAGFDRVVYSVALDAGKIYAGGSFNNYDTTPVAKLIRLNSDGSRDAGFTQNVNGLNGDVLSVTVQTNDKVVAGGEFTQYGGSSASRLIRFNTDGVRDATFQTGAGFDGDVTSVAIQSNGRIVVGGAFTEYAGSDASRLIRVLADGTRDTSYNVAESSLSGQVSAVAVQFDGKILVGGDFTRYGGDNASNLMRLNADGTRDTGFVQSGAGLDNDVNAILPLIDGLALVGGAFRVYGDAPAPHLIQMTDTGAQDTGFMPRTTGLDGDVDALALQPDSRILVGGSFLTRAGTLVGRLTRLNPDGSRDTGFNPAGAGFTGGDVEVIVVQPDGKILVGGLFTQYNGVEARRLIRLNPDGSRDPGFTVASGGFNNVVQAIVVQPDGKILVGGDFTTYGGAPARRLIRLNADGSRDTGFSQGADGLDNRVSAIALQPDGRIVAGGSFSTYESVAASRLIRFNANGSRDAGFVQVGAGIDGNEVRSLILQPDGKILACGDFTAYNGNPAFGTLRLNTDGVPDPAFRQTVAGNNDVYSAALQQDGKVLIGGSFNEVAGLFQQVVRLNPDGSVDTGFRTDLGWDGYVDAVALQPDGKLVAGGGFATVDAQPYAFITRLIGGPSTVVAEPGSLVFADQKAGTSSQPRAVTVTNNGAASVTFDSVSLAGVDPGQFGLVSNTCTGNAVLPGASCQVRLRFSPTSNGGRSAALQIVSDAQNPLLSVAISGTSPTKPGKPGRLKVKATAKKVKGSWGAAPRASSYTMTVKGKSRKGKNLSRKKSTTKRSATVKASFAGKVKVCVVAVNVSGNSPKRCVKKKSA